MSIYLTGCLVAFILAMTLTIMDYYDGVVIEVGEVLSWTAIITVSSWVASFLLCFMVVPEIVTLLNKIKFRRNPK